MPDDGDEKTVEEVRDEFEEKMDRLRRQYERDLHSFRYEIEEREYRLKAYEDKFNKIKQPPLLYAFVVRKEGPDLDGNQVVVARATELLKVSTGLVDKSQLSVGQYVWVHPQTYAIVEGSGTRHEGVIAKVADMLDGKLVISVEGDMEKRIIDADKKLLGKLKPGFQISVLPPTMEILEILPNLEVKSLLLGEKPNVRYANIGGLNAEIDRILSEEKARAERLLGENIALHEALVTVLLEAIRSGVHQELTITGTGGSRTVEGPDLVALAWAGVSEPSHASLERLVGRSVRGARQAVVATVTMPSPAAMAYAGEVGLGVFAVELDGGRVGELVDEDAGEARRRGRCGGDLDPRRLRQEAGRGGPEARVEGQREARQPNAPEGAEAALEPTESVEDLVTREDLARAVERAMANLPAEQRTAIVLKEYHGLTFQEIADLVGCPLSTVKTRLYQGLTVLRRELAKSGTL